MFGRANYRKDFCVSDLGDLFSGGLIFFFFFGGGGGGGLLSEFYGSYKNETCPRQAWPSGKGYEIR